MDIAGAQKFVDFDFQRQTLIAYIDRCLDVLGTLGSEVLIDAATNIRQIVETDTFKVLVIGEFKTGKSTFINALLRDRVLPAYAIPTTAVINEVKWGVEPRALLHFLPDADGNIQPPLEVPVQDLEDYVVIRDFASKEEELRGSPYARIELFWEIDLCRHGVEIIDSPGLNENVVREKITRDYINRVDAVLFIFAATQFGPSMHEQNAIEDLRAIGHEDIFFIVNRFDQLATAQDQEQIRQYAGGKLKGLTERKEGVFFISSQLALDGYLYEDQAKIDQSGFVPLERALSQFLAEERGRIKLLRAGRELNIFLHEARRLVPESLAMQKTDMETLQARYEGVRGQLEQLQRDRDLIVNRIAHFRQDQRDIVVAKVKSFYAHVMNRVPEWIESYEFKHPLNARDLLNFDAAAKRVLGELLDFLGEKIETEFRAWQDVELLPYLLSRLEELRAEIDERADEFISRIEQVRLEVAEGAILPSPERTRLPPSVTPTDRLIGTVGGLALGGPSAAAVGYVFGSREMLKVVGVQLGAVVFMSLLGISFPFILPVIIAAGPGYALLKLSEANRKIKADVRDRFIEDLAEQSEHQAAASAAIIDQRLGDIQRLIDAGMSSEIHAVKADVERELHIKSLGQQEVKQRVAALESAGRALDALDYEVDEFMNGLRLGASRR